jgi:hypothetical protein
MKTLLPTTYSSANIAPCPQRSNEEAGRVRGASQQGDRTPSQGAAYSRGQLLANAAIAASRVESYPCGGVRSSGWL